MIEYCFVCTYVLKVFLSSTIRTHKNTKPRTNSTQPFKLIEKENKININTFLKRSTKKPKASHDSQHNDYITIYWFAILNSQTNFKTLQSQNKCKTDSEC